MFLFEIDQLKGSELKNDSFCQVIGYDAIFTLKNVIVWFGNGCDRMVSNLSLWMLKNYRVVKDVTCVSLVALQFEKEAHSIVFIQFSVMIPPKILFFLIENVLQYYNYYSQYRLYEFIQFQYIFVCVMYGMRS